MKHTFKFLTFLLLFALSFGFNQEVKADPSTGYSINYPYIYFLNNDNWSQCGVLYGRKWGNNDSESYTSMQNMTKVSNTEKLYYAEVTSYWNNTYNQIAIVAANGWGGTNQHIEARYNDVSHTGVYYNYTMNYHNTYYITSSGSSNIDISYKSDGYGGIPKYKTTLQVQTRNSTGDYSAINSNAPATLTVGGTYLSDNGKSTTAYHTSNWPTGSQYESVITGLAQVKYSSMDSKYQFDGWYVGSTNQGTGTSYEYYQSAATTVIAKFTRIKYTVTLDADGGTGGTTSVTATYNEAMPTISSSNFPTRTGFTFDGYYTGKNGTGTKYYNANGTSAKTCDLTDNITLYAKWAVVLTVSKGTGISSVSESVNPASLDGQYDISATTLTGYNFNQWTASPAANAQFMDASSASTKVTIKNGSVTVTATATEILHSVTMAASDNNKGTVAITSDNTTAGIATPITIQATPKAGYYFIGWTASDGSKVTFGNAKSETTTANVTADDITITANFAERFYLRGSSTEDKEPTKGMPGWNNDAQESGKGLFTSINGTTATITMSLNASTTYKLKLGDLADGSSWGGSSAQELTNGVEWQFTSHEENCNAPTFRTAIAGTYTFTIDFSEASPKMKITYPAVPDFTLTVAEARVYEETPMANFIAGNGTVENPYQFYLDEKMTLTVTALSPVTGVTAYYKFGDDDESSSVLTKDITAANTTVQSIVVKTYYKGNIGSYTSAEKTETIYYQGVSIPALHLSASWNEKEESELSDNPEVTIYYNADDYSGAATVKSSIDGVEDQDVFMTITTEIQMEADYQMANKNPHRYDFEATATVNDRDFEATTSVSIYRLVKVTISDPNHLMTHYYAWIDGSKPIQYEKAWPGKEFEGKLGDAHIFFVKYPSYTHFVLNDGKAENATQTVDIQLPTESTCYTIGGKTDNKYTVNSGSCPPILYVGNIENVTIAQGESQLIAPDVDLDYGYSESQLTITFPQGLPTGFTAVQQGKKFLLTGNTQCAATSIKAVYTLSDGVNTHSEERTFNATVTHPSHILIQVKYKGDDLGWGQGDHNNTWLHYWGVGINDYVQMTWKDYVGDQDRFYAQVPLASNGIINFQVGYPEGKNWYSWRQTDDVNSVSQPGCYTITSRGDNQNRVITRNDDYCWAEYQVKIDMASGVSYTSNAIENMNDIVSFYAPGKNETGTKSGLVRIMRNGTQVATVDGNLFNKSGVYTAKIVDNGGIISLDQVAPYEGDYYIRTDGAEGGWSDYKKTSHKFTNFSLYDGAKYNYYWTKNVKNITSLNVKGCVANDYNKNLTGDLTESSYTDIDGKILGTIDSGTGVNLRFGYNPETNYLERAILRGSTASANYFLNVQGDNVFNDKACSAQELNETNYGSHPEYSVFNDVSDWVYEKLIYVKIDGSHPSASILLKSKDFNDQVMYQLGYTTDYLGRTTEIPAQRVVMGQGTSQSTYALRVIYDYKTNRLSASWEPSDEINDVRKVDADILFVSNGGHDVNQITFGKDSADARLESLQSVMFVLEIEKNSNDQQTASDEQYWFSLPFECKISDIFGVENYITLDANRIATQGYWGIMRYRGDLRAKYGWFEEDRPEGFWEWMYPTETLMPGEGYVLYVEIKSLSWNSITVEEPCEEGDEGCVDGKRSVSKYVKRFYFPSLVKGFTMNKSTEASSTINYPDQPCNIKNRQAEDSNWKVIAPNSYNNITLSSATGSDEGHRINPNFIYTYESGHYEPQPTANYEFKAFRGYMAQYGGKMTWQPFSKTEHPKSAPRFAEESEFKGGTMTIELVQNNEQLDRTFVKLSKNGTEGFDQNLDLTKITENCAQIASVSEDVLYAGNTLPLDIEMVPLNVKVVANGTYDIALAQSLEGLEVRLYDAFEQTTTPLDLMSATITLDKGEYKDRFFLQFVQKSPLTPTNFNGTIEQFNLPSDKTQKLLINDNIYLINGGRIYNVLGVGE